MINEEERKKFQVTIHFVMDDDFMSAIPKHRQHINQLIEKEIIDQYLVSMESQTVWITMTALDKEEALQILKKSPLFPYFRKIRIEILFLVDGLHYRFPALQPN